MKFLLAAALMLALGIGQGAAQTGAPMSGGMVGAPSPSGMGATSPLGADFGETASQSAAQTGTRAQAAWEQRHRSGRISAGSR